MILLTGASGFIGKHLLAALQKRYGVDNVLALTSKPIKTGRYLIHNDYNFESDFFEKNGCYLDIDTIIMAGAFIPKNSTQANDWFNCNNNIFTVDKLLKVRLPNLKKIVFLSSVDVYGDESVVSEDTSAIPLTLYGHSKLYCEMLLNSWAGSENRTLQVLRVGHVYGPGEESFQKIIPLTMKRLLNNEKIEIWGSGNDLRAFIYVDDVVKAILKSIHLHDNVGPINIVSDRSVSIKEIVETIIGLSKKNVNINYIESNAKQRSLSFKNDKLLRYLLEQETSLSEGLMEEWNYMKTI